MDFWRLSIVSSHRQIRFEYNAKVLVQRNRISLKPVGKSSQADSNFIFVNIPKTRGKPACWRNNYFRWEYFDFWFFNWLTECRYNSIGCGALHYRLKIVDNGTKIDANVHQSSQYHKSVVESALIKFIHGFPSTRWACEISTHWRTH